MRVYLASRFSRREELAGYAERLAELGHIVTSRWLTDPGHRIELDDLKANQTEINMRLAKEDLIDVRQADCLIFFGPGSSRGGCHVEFGVALGLERRIWWVGERSRVFSWLPCVGWAPDFSALLSALPGV